MSSKPLTSQGIRPQDAIEALSRILASRIVPQVIVSSTDPSTLLESTDHARDSTLLEHIGNLPAAPAHGRPELATPYAPPRDAFETRLAAIWSALLGVDRVGRHDNFFELGGDSVVAIQMIAKAYHDGIKLTPQQLFQRPTIADLAETLQKPSEHLTLTKASGNGETATPQPIRAFALSGLDEQELSALSRRLDQTTDDRGAAR
jgi:aryl carrier-like protein